MSTSYGFRCLSHDPPLDSDYLCSHSEGKRRLLTTLANRSVWVQAVVADLNRTGTMDFDSEIWWLWQHPHCDVVVVSEYGDIVSAEESARGPA